MMNEKINVLFELKHTEDGGRQSSLSGSGVYRPTFVIGNTHEGEIEHNSGRITFNGDDLLPGYSALAEVTPLFEEHWGHVKPGDRFPVHEGRHVVGYIEVLSDEVVSQYKRLEGSVERTRAWYGVRLERLRDWADTLPEEEKTKYFNIVANGTSSPFEPPTYAQQLNITKFKKEAAKEKLNKLADISRSLCYIAYNIPDWAANVLEARGSTHKDVVSRLRDHATAAAKLKDAMEKILNK